MLVFYLLDKILYFTYLIFLCFVLSLLVQPQTKKGFFFYKTEDK